MISLTKKILSIALAAVLLLGVFPAAAFAAGGPHTVYVYYQNDAGNDMGFAYKVDPAAKGSLSVDDGYVLKADDAQLTAQINANMPANKEFVGVVWGNGNAIGGVAGTDGDPATYADSVFADRNVIVLTKDKAAAHTHNYIDEVVKPTCTEKGYTKHTCACGDSYQDSETAALGHDWGEWKVVTAPKVGVEGLQERTCKRGCGAKETQAIPALLPTPTYTVTIKSGASGVTVPASTITVEENSNYTNLPALTKEGYTLIGFRRDDNMIVNNGDAVMNANHTLTGVWDKNSYRVDFLDASGAVMYTEWVEHGDKILNAPSYTSAGDKNGQHPTKWSVDVNAPVYSNLTISPVYSNDIYTITLKAGYEGGATRYQNVRYGERIGKFFPNGKLPVLSRNRYILDGFYLEGTDEKWTEETIYNVEGDVTLVARWVEEARVKVMIYRNGKTSSAYDEVQVPGYKVGDTIYTKDIKIEDYYKNGGKPFKFDGWYDRQGWVLYKAGEFHSPAETVKTVGLDGTTLLFCMITDSSAPSNSNPDRTNPKTGDESMIFATTAVMLVSAGALAIYFMDRKRRNG